MMFDGMMWLNLKKAFLLLLRSRRTATIRSK